MKRANLHKKIGFTAGSGALMLAAAFACKSYHPDAAKTLSENTGGTSSYYDMSKIPGQYVGKVGKVTIDTGNASAFAAKLNAVKNAKHSIELQYFIFGDYNFDHDYTSATMMRELVEKAKEGVKVRIIVDDGTTRKWRDDFIAFKNEAIKAGAGKNLEIAYFRPYSLDHNHPLKYAETLYLEVQANLKAKKYYPRTILQLLLNPQSAIKDFLGPNFDPVKGVQVAMAAHQAQKDTTAIQDHGFDAISSTLFDVFGKTPTPSTYPGFIAALFSKAIGRKVTEQQALDIINVLKRTHHKLTVVDGKFASGGGRNMWDISHLDFNHPLRPENRKNDYDVDFIIDDENFAKAMVKSFDEYWDCLDNKSCKAGIPMVRELGTQNKSLLKATKDPAADAERARLAAVWKSRILADAETYDKRHSEPPRLPPHLKTSIEAYDVETAYTENKMWKAPNDPHDLPSDILATWTQLIDQTPASKTVIIHNAYFLLPTEMVVSVVKAINRGVKFVFITTGREVNDTPLLSDLMRMQAEALMNLFEKVGKKDFITVYEAYHYQQSHTKTSAIGDYLVVGSANADPRSAYLNTENVAVIGPGKAAWNGRVFGSASEAYQAWIMSEMEDPKNAERFRKITLEDIRIYLDHLDNATAIKTVRDWFAASVRLGIEIDKNSNDYRDRKTTAKCRDGKEGFNQIGCSMRTWLFEQLFLQL